MVHTRGHLLQSLDEPRQILARVQVHVLDEMLGSHVETATRRCDYQHLSTL